MAELNDDKQRTSSSGDTAGKEKAAPQQTTPKSGVDANDARAQPKLMPGTILRSERKGKVTVKANLARDLSILLGFIALMTIFCVATLKDVGKAKDPEGAVDESRKPRRNNPGAQVKQAIKETFSKFKATSTVTVDKDLVCDLYLAESSIPKAGMGIYSARSFNKGDVVIGPGRVFSLIGTHDPKGWSSISEHGMIIKPHPRLFNVEGGHKSCEEESCNYNAGSQSSSFKELISSAFVATRAISPGDELFVSFSSDVEEHLASSNTLFATVPTVESYALADDIISDELNGLTTETEVSGGRWARGSKQAKRTEIKRTVDANSLTVVKKTVSRFDERAAALLPESQYQMFQGSRHGSAYASMKNRTTNWLYDNGACFDGIQPSTDTAQISGRGGFAKHNIPRGKVIISAPLYVMESGTGDMPSSAINHCFGNDDMPLVLCPLSLAHRINHRSAGQKLDSEEECENGPNAQYNWSRWNTRNSDAHKLGIDEVLKKYQLGLSFDIIATRDIKKGEEIHMDYSWNMQEDNGKSDTFQHPNRLRDDVIPDGWRSRA